MFCNNLPSKFYSMYWKIGDKFQMLSIFVSNFAFRHKPCDAPLYFCVIFYSLKKMCFQKWILLSLMLFFNFISHLKQKYWNFVLLPNHRQSFLTLVFSEYEEGIRADSPRIVLNLNIYAYIIYKNVSSKLFCTSSNVLKEI